MPPNPPWIDAVLDSFPEDTPHNDRRRDLLIEASTAVPPSWRSEAATTSPPPEAFRRRHLPHRLAIDTLHALTMALLLWNLWISPDARHRLRGIALADLITGSMTKSRLSGPLAGWFGVIGLGDHDSWPTGIEDDLRRRIPPEKHETCLGFEGAETRAERWAGFWSSAPDSPMILADQAATMADSNQTLSASFLAHTAIHDPGNAYYGLLALTGSTEDCISDVHPPPNHRHRRAASRRLRRGLP